MFYFLFLFYCNFKTSDHSNQLLWKDYQSAFLFGRLVKGSKCLCWMEGPVCKFVRTVWFMVCVYSVRSESLLEQNFRTPKFLKGRLSWYLLACFETRFHISGFPGTCPVAKDDHLILLTTPSLPPAHHHHHGITRHELPYGDYPVLGLMALCVFHKCSAILAVYPCPWYFKILTDSQKVWHRAVNAWGQTDYGTLT